LLVLLAADLDGSQIDVPKNAQDGFGFGCFCGTFWIASINASDSLPGFCQVLADNMFEQGQRSQGNAQKSDQTSSPVVIL